MRQLHRFSDEQKIEILQGLIQLRKDGHFAAIHAQGEQLRVQYAVGGPKLLLGWRQAARMVAKARETAGLEPAGLLAEVQKLPVAKSLRPRRSATAAAAAAGGSAGR
jgi:hypothetical protein